MIHIFLDFLKKPLLNLHVVTAVHWYIDIKQTLNISKTKSDHNGDDNTG